MVNQKILDYIKSNEAKGFTLQQIADHLVNQGQNVEDVNDAILEFNQLKTLERNKLRKENPNKFVLQIGVSFVIMLILYSFTFILSKIYESTNILLVSFILLLGVIALWAFGIYLVNFEIGLKNKKPLWILAPLFFGGVGVLVYYFKNKKEIKF